MQQPNQSGDTPTRVREWLLFGLAFVGLFASGVGFLFSVQSDINRNSDWRVEDAKRVYELSSEINSLRRDLDKLSSECPLRTNELARRIELLEEVFPTLSALVNQVQISNQIQTSRFQREIGMGGMGGTNGVSNDAQK
jgi:hypothetical protein